MPILRKITGSKRREKFFFQVFANVFFALILALSAPHFLFAAPPDSPYAPGETLNPLCSPGATNCTVEQIHVATTTLNYGISTSSPLARLTVSATSSLSNISLFRVEAAPSAGATTTALIVTSSGKVGIGTTSPAYALHILVSTSTTNATPTDVAALEITGPGGVTGAGPALLFLDKPGGTPDLMGRIAAVYEANSPKTGLAFYTNGLNNDVNLLFEVVRMTGSGRLAIGTTTPNNRLDIYSTSKSAIGFSGASGGTYKWTIGMDVTNGGRFSIASSTALGTLDRFVIDGNGKVGIGTTTPWAKLSVSSLAVDGTAPLFTISSSTLTGTTTVFHVDYTGNVGIGTTSPYAKLSVVGEVVGANFTATSTTATSTFAGGLTVGNNTAFVVNQAAAANALTIDPNGSVGIGTAVPNAVLDIETSTNANIFTAVTSSNPGMSFTLSANSALFTRSSTNSATLFKIKSLDTSSVRAVMEVQANNGSTEVLWAGADGSVGIGTTTPWAKLSVSSLASNGFAPLFTISSSTLTGTTTVFHVDYTGNVGIGTTSPYAKLSVVGEVAAANFTATSTSATSTFLGGVGIGTSTPSAPLSVSGNAYFAGLVGISGPPDTASGIQLSVNGDVTIPTTGWYRAGGTILISGDSTNTFISNNSGYIAFRSAASEKMRMTSSGTFGIGTTTPAAKFSIDQGSATTLGMYIAGYANATVDLLRVSTSTLTATSTALVLDSSGNLGIGTTSPWRTLSVTGTVAINGLTSNATANAVCILAGGEITTAGGAVCNGVSSQRFKHDIASSTLGLPTLLAMRPVSFRYNEGYGDSGKGEQFGLIAEEIYAIDPRLAVLDAEGLPTTVRYDFLSPILIKAVQELNLKIEAVASSTSGGNALDISSESSILKLWQVIVSKLSDAGVFLGQAFARITNLFAGTLHVEDKLCADEVCVTKEQLKTLLIQAGGSPTEPSASSPSTLYPLPSTNSPDTTPPTITILGNPGTTSSQSSDGYGASNPAADVEPPIIKLIGNNPATIDVGTTYIDPGATVDDNVDHNLGIHTSGAKIDTTISGTYTVTYTATDQAGNAATSTRTVMVRESPQISSASSPEHLPAEEASTTLPMGE